MRWPDVVPALLDLLEADAIIEPIVGPAIYRTGRDRDFRVPSIEYTVISDVEEERFNPIRIQWDTFTRTDADLVAIERQMRRLMHHDVPTEIGGIGMWSQYVSRQDIPGLEDGIRGSSTDFIYTPIRSRYVRAEAS